MNSKKIILFISFFLAVAAIAGITSVSADDDKNVSKLEKAFSNVEKHIAKLLEVKDKISDDDLKNGRAGSSLLITPSGNARVTNGEVVSLTPPNFTLKIWGKEYLVMTDSQSTKFVGAGKEIAFDSLKAGHRVDVMGEMMTESGHEGHIKARMVRDRSLVSEEQQQKIDELKKKIQELIDRLQKLLRDTGGGTSTSTATTTSSQ